MPYRVRGYPRLETARPSGTAAQLDAGRVDVRDVRPAVLRGLEAVGERLHRTLTIFSGYRTDAYSQAVGGFAGDPHTQGIAADVNVGGTPIGSVPHAIRYLRDAGLISGAQPGFYQGRSDPAHVQLAGPSTTPNITLESLWIKAGGSPKVARTMAAIALAESGGRVDAKGGPNADGSYDFGLWEINSSHAMYDPARLMSDPLYNAQAAVAIYRSQGLGAWTTYRSGAYKRYLSSAANALPQGTPRSRPGGAPVDSAGDASGDPEAALASFTIPSPRNMLPPPFGNWTPWGETAREWHNLSSLFGAAGSTKEAIQNVAQGVMWIFSPRHALRAMEILAGGGLMALGLWTSVKVFEGSAPRGPKAATRALTRTVSRAGPQGRAAGLALGAAERRGRGQGERRGFSEGFAQGEMHTEESARQREQKRSDRDASRRARLGSSAREGGRRAIRGPSNEIPF